VRTLDITALEETSAMRRAAPWLRRRLRDEIERDVRLSDETSRLLTKALREHGKRERGEEDLG